LLCSFWGRGFESPSNTMWPGPRRISLPSFILLHPTVWPQYTNVTDIQDRQAGQRSDSIRANRFWASPYAIGPLSVLSSLSVCPVCDVRALWTNGWTDQDETWHAGRPRLWPHCIRWEPISVPQRGGGGAPPNFLPISVVAKWLHGSRCHLIWRKDLAQATLC